MKQLIIFIAIALIAGHLLTEASIFIQWRWPQTREIYVHPFIRGSYRWYDDRGVNILWWVYYCANDFLWVIVVFCLTKIAFYFSTRLFYIGCVFFVYHLIDGFMLWYDYKQSSGKYWLLEICCGLSIFCMFLPEKKGKVKSII